MSMRNKKKRIIILLKGFVNQSVIAQSTNFSQFFFSHWLLFERFFSFLIKAFVNFENWKDFIGKLLLYIKMEKIWEYL